jgi:hypothetical protein
VVTFDEIPTELQAGTTHPVSFSILSHGKEPIVARPTSVRFQGPDGETLTFDARYDGEGRYTAEVTLPRSGQWQWAVVTGEYVRRDLGDDLGYPGGRRHRSAHLPAGRTPDRHIAGGHPAHRPTDSGSASRETAVAGHRWDLSGPESF